MAVPMPRASCVSMSLAVSTSSRTRPIPTSAPSRTRLAAEKQFPSVRATGTPNLAEGAATRRSQAAAMASPPPITGPRSAAIVGLHRGDGLALVQLRARGCGRCCQALVEVATPHHLYRAVAERHLHRTGPTAHLDRVADAEHQVADGHLEAVPRPRREPATARLVAAQGGALRAVVEAAR